MKRVARMVVIAVVWITLTVYGCASSNMAELTTTSRDVIPNEIGTGYETFAVGRTAGVSAPVSVVRGISPYNGGYILYPQVQSVSAAQRINDSMCDAVAEKARRLDAPVFTNYRVEHNHDGIFSVRIYLYNLYGTQESCLDSVSLNYDVNNGELCSISDIFDGSNDRWRGLLPDIVTAQAQDRDMTLLNDLMPVDDNQEFYVTDDSVVLLYDVYEIATYPAGAPEFSIPIRQLDEFIDDNGPLGEMKVENMAKPEAVDAAMEAK